MASANRANRKRYRNILQGYGSLRNRVLGQVGQFGQQQRKDIDESYRNMEARGYQDLVNRGFGNSSLPMTMRMGYQRERQEALGRLNENLARQYAAYDTGISGDMLGVMERRTDQGPDYNQMIGLAQGLGQAGYGGGGGPSYRFGFGGQPGNFADAFNQARMQHMFMAGAFGNPLQMMQMRQAQMAANRPRR